MKGGLAAIVALSLGGCIHPGFGGMIEVTGPTEEWYRPDEVGVAFSALTIHPTSAGLAGRLVTLDGFAVALRNVRHTEEVLSFTVPALGASFSATELSTGRWAGEWLAQGSAAPVQVIVESWPRVATPPEFATLPDGRQMHMTCAGEGAPAVILDYGAGGTMKKDWGDLAATISAEAKTRVCAYDRAGRGLSDPAATTRTAAAVASDIEQMLTAANIQTPVVVVGHSLGSYHVRQFANSYPDKTAGLVLVDPSGDGQLERFNAAIPQMAQLQADRVKTQADLNCVDRLVAKPVPPDDPLAQQCGGNDPVAISATMSEIEEMPGASTASLVATRRSYGDMPVIVLTRTDYDSGMPPTFTQQDKDAMRSIWESMHAEMAALSTRGEQRFIPNAGHYIQRDAPEAVVKAVADVVAAVRVQPE